MSWQSAYNFFKMIRTPKWLAYILGEIQEIVLSILWSIGKEYLENIKNKIITVSEMPISPREKFDEVFNYIRKELDLKHIKDSAVHLLIEILVNHLKKKGMI